MCLCMTTFFHVGYWFYLRFHGKIESGHFFPHYLKRKKKNQLLLCWSRITAPKYIYIFFYEWWTFEKECRLCCKTIHLLQIIMCCSITVSMQKKISVLIFIETHCFSLFLYIFLQSCGRHLLWVHKSRMIYCRIQFKKKKQLQDEV